jgi:hypothetical protein
MYGGSSRNPRPIYGKRCDVIPDTCVEDSVYLETLSTLVETIRQVVGEFFPKWVGYAQVIGELGATSMVPAPIFVRFVWAKTHPGVKYTNSEYQQFELIDIYLQNPPLNWKDDAYITVTLPV